MSSSQPLRISSASRWRTQIHEWNGALPFAVPFSAGWRAKFVLNADRVLSLSVSIDCSLCNIEAIMETKLDGLTAPTVESGIAPQAAVPLPPENGAVRPGEKVQALP